MKKSIIFACLLLSCAALACFSGCWKKSNQITPPPRNGPYVGALVCSKCHEDIYQDYLTTGHSQQFQLVTNGQAPEYFWNDEIPFPVANPPNGLTWDDISLVLGGHYNHGVFFDNKGFLITGPQSLWRIQSGTWSNYLPGQSLPYDCASCHTSGYDRTGIQKEFPGLRGTWEQNGVTCEGCHGPGRGHVISRNSEDILVDKSDGFCLRCHRGLRDHFYLGFGDVDLGSSHGGTCSQCHNPHVSFKYEFERSMWRTCQDCHQSDDPALIMEKIKRNGICGG